MAIHHPHDMNMAASPRAHDLKLTPIEPFRHIPLLHSPTPHTHPRHVAVSAHSLPLLVLVIVDVVHLFDPLISLHDKSIRHGTHGGGLATRATMTTNTFGSGSWTSACTYWGWDGNTPSTRLEHGSLIQSTLSQAHPHG